MCNAIVNALVNAVASITLLRDRISTEILYNPSIPDNIGNLRVFDDEQQILHFMASTDVFKYTSIYEDEHEQSL